MRNHVLLEDPIESVLTANVHVFFFRVPGHWIQPVLVTFWKRKDKQS